MQSASEERETDAAEYLKPTTYGRSTKKHTGQAAADRIFGQKTLQAFQNDGRMQPKQKASDQPSAYLTEYPTKMPRNHSQKQTLANPEHSYSPFNNLQKRHQLQNPPSIQAFSLKKGSKLILNKSRNHHEVHVASVGAHHTLGNPPNLRNDESFYRSSSSVTAGMKALPKIVQGGSIAKS